MKIRKIKSKYDRK